MALEAGVERLLFFYHHPDRDDDAVDAQIAAQRERVAAAGAVLRDRVRPRGDRDRGLGTGGPCTGAKSRPSRP